MREDRGRWMVSGRCRLDLLRPDVLVGGEDEVQPLQRVHRLVTQLLPLEQLHQPAVELLQLRVLDLPEKHTAHLLLSFLSPSYRCLKYVTLWLIDSILID